MCSSGGRTPDPVTPAAAPAPAAANVMAPQIGGAEEKNQDKASLLKKKKGKSALRIDLSAGSSLGKTGLNVAQ